MKLVVNYDLLDKVCEAKKGISLNKITKKVGTLMGIATPVLSIDNIVGSEPLSEFFGGIAFTLFYYGSYYYLLGRVTADSTKAAAECELSNLSRQLKDIFVDTDPELLKESYGYKTEYAFNFKDSTLPKLEQRKYVIVPVHSDWENNTRSLVQEHVIGSREYTLSHGEPKEKVLTLGQKKFAQK